MRDEPRHIYLKLLWLLLIWGIVAFVGVTVHLTGIAGVLFGFVMGVAGTIATIAIVKVDFNE